MTENEIRNKTNELLEAYRGITGSEFVPEVKEYILLRKQAIAELSGNIAVNRNRIVPAAGTKKEPERPVPEPAAEKIKYIEDTPAEKRRLPEPANTMPEPSVIPGPSAGPIKNGLSEFEILRGIKDPWNQI